MNLFLPRVKTLSGILEKRDFHSFSVSYLSTTAVVNCGTFTITHDILENDWTTHYRSDPGNVQMGFQYPETWLSNSSGFDRYSIELIIISPNSWLIKVTAVREIKVRDDHGRETTLTSNMRRLKLKGWNHLSRFRLAWKHKISYHMTHTYEACP